MHKNDEYLFDDEERSELEDKDYMKDPSLDDLFPDKKDVDINRLLRNYEEKFQENDKQNEKEVKKDEKSDDGKIAKKEKVKMKTWQKIVVVIICVALTCGSGLGFLLYGPYPNFREWLITTAMTTMRHQYLAKWFYSQKTIDSVLKNNYVKSVDEDTDLNAITFVDYSKSKGMYKNKYEKEILSHEDGEKYKLININSDGMRGYLVAIYDASKVKVGTATNLNVKGEMLTTIAKNNKAIVAMNASGFNDPGYMGNGSKPHGVVIRNGKVVSNNGNVPVSGGVLGFTKDNKFIMKKMTAEQALEKGIRDAVEFGPFLIVNGTPSFIKGNGGWGTAPRSAIGQRQDGIVLFLVMDGRDYAHGIDGVGMVELTEILMKYGAYNAANLDGGTSSGLVINNQLINKPVNGSGQKSTRAIPDAWIVTE
ncbi:MAG: phosphodiester glycosidase family protein [Bacilli bacterium]|nr:phosphodiester glycosidase family protein [Bacilli bacterium]